jgi:hypothetical protein
VRFPKKGVFRRFLSIKRSKSTKILQTGAQNLYGDDYFCFQQDRTLSHKAKIVQNWFEEKPDFISRDEFWKDLTGFESTVFESTTEKLQIPKIWAAIPDHVVHATCKVFEKCLRLVIQFNGQPIEKCKVFIYVL